jgi:hypothetical protein
VRCGEQPRVQIPTDDELKRYGKKLPKPEKSMAVAATKERTRFRYESKYVVYGKNVFIGETVK